MPRHLPFTLGIEPLTGFMVLTGRAMSVAAGSKHPVGITTVFARIQGPTPVTGPTGYNCLDYFDMIGRYPGTKPIQIFRSKGAEYLLNGIHDHTAFIKSLMMPQARSWPWVVR